MSSNVIWYAARIGGLTAWAMLSATVLLGLFAATRLLGRRATPAKLQAIHQHLGEITMAFVGVHVLALLADSYVHFGIVDVLVPFASSWRPLAVAFGVVAFWTLLAVWLTSVARAHLSRRVWRTVHLASYVTYVATSIHLMTAGTDAWSPVVQVANFAVSGAVAGLTVVAFVRQRNRRAAGGSTPRLSRPTGTMPPGPAPAPAAVRRERVRVSA